MRWFRTRSAIALQVGGLAAVAIGCGLLSAAAGLIAGGVGLILLGVAREQEEVSADGAGPTGHP